MRVHAIVATIWFLFPFGAAMAEWKVESYKDRMTDREVKSATLDALKPDNGIGATLIVRCMINDVVGGLYLELRTTALFTRGRMGLGYRVDDGQINDRFMSVSPDRRGMALFAKPRELFDGKRLRLELEPANSTKLFYEFDLRGTRKSLSSIPCKETDLQ